jgi:tetratricopeptide (TPR) repeat protein
VGTQNAYKYFGDEGVDLGQRTKEMVAYYRRVLKPAGQMGDVLYDSSDEGLKGRDMQCLGRDRERDRNLLSQAERSGTIFVGVHSLAHTSYWDRPALRAAVPIARLGNLFIYQGTIHLSGNAVGFLYYDAQEKLHAVKPDVALAEKDLQMSVDLDPAAFFAHIELANLLLNRGARDGALREYSQALRYAPADPQICLSIESQIQRVSSEPAGTVRPLRNPVLE